jgi:hypothetical protein
MNAAVAEPRDELEGLVDEWMEPSVRRYLDLLPNAAEVRDDGDGRCQCSVSVGWSGFSPSWSRNFNSAMSRVLACSSLRTGSDRRRTSFGSP